MAYEKFITLNIRIILAREDAQRNCVSEGRNSRLAVPIRHSLGTISSWVERWDCQRYSAALAPLPPVPPSLLIALLSSLWSPSLSFFFVKCIYLIHINKMSKLWDSTIFEHGKNALFKSILTIFQMGRNTLLLEKLPVLSLKCNYSNSIIYFFSFGVGDTKC